LPDLVFPESCGRFIQEKDSTSEHQGSCQFAESPFAIGKSGGATVGDLGHTGDLQSVPTRRS
jgi:hypothetical protein